ncbi:MAG TPA: 6-bladed beta-propeller [bacterium]|nr:6-bladed beta-propeller [bacterium]
MGPENRIAIATHDRNAILILNNDGSYWKTIGGVLPGRTAGQFQFITSLRATTNHLYSVECYDNPRVQIFDVDGNFIGQLGMTAGEFLNPWGITIRNEKIYVCDYRQGKIVIFDNQGKFDSEIIIPYKNSDLAFGDLSLAVQPSRIVFDETGKIYLLDDNHGRIAILNASGSSFETSISPKDESNYYFKPAGMALAGDYLYVAGNNQQENKGSKVFVYDKKGILQKTFASTTAYRYKDITAYNGRLYLLTDDENPYFDSNPGLMVYDTNGNLITTLSEIKNGDCLAIDSTGRIFVSNWYQGTEKSTFAVFDQQGDYLWHYLSSEPMEARGIAVDSSFNVYFSDVTNCRVHKFSTAENILATLQCQVDNTSPTAQISFPPHSKDCNILQDFSLIGTVIDKNLQYYEISVDNEVVHTGNNSIRGDVLGKVSISGISNDRHIITLFVQDLAGNIQTDTVAFYSDPVVPSSNVNSLPAYTRNISFQVSWAGSDTGSGIASYDIQYKDGESGIWKNWLVGTSLTSAEFTGEDGHIYYFRSRARDRAGNLENYSDDYDTFTQVDVSPPVFKDICPADGSYAGTKPTIAMQVIDPNNGSGILSSGISVYLDGWPISSLSNEWTFSQETGILTITPEFTIAIHTIKVIARDRAGNVAEINLTYDALNFQGSVTTISPDPNPVVSEIMIGGEVIRWYQAIAQDNSPVSGVSLTVEWDNGKKRITTASSDQNGVVACKIKSTDLGNPGSIVTCTITEAGSQKINPISFQVKILPRQSNSEFKFDFGAEAQEATGAGFKGGGQKEVIYRLINTNLQSQSDDIIELERELEINGGAVVGGSVGIEMGESATAQGEGELAQLMLLKYGSTFSFDNPYTSQQKLMRAGLLVDSLLTGVVDNPLVDALIRFIATRYNMEYPNYKTKQWFSLGTRIEGSLSAGCGLQLGTGENGGEENGKPLLNLGVGADLTGKYELIGSLISSGFYLENNQLMPAEIGARITAGGQLELQATAQAEVIGKEISATFTGETLLEYQLTLFTDAQTRVPTSAEMKISHLGEWGLQQENDVDIKKSFIITLNSDQIQAIADRLSDMRHLKELLQNMTQTESTIFLSPSEVVEKFNALCNQITGYLLSSGMPVSYRIEDEISQNVNKFDPSFEVGAGAEVELGIELATEKSVTIVREQGIFGLLDGKVRKYPHATYNQDSYVPSLSTLDFSTVYQDCIGAIITAMLDVGALVIQAGQQVGEVVVNLYNYASDTVGEILASWTFVKSDLTKQLDSGFGRVFSFVPDISIGQLSSNIDQTYAIGNGVCTIEIKPQQTSARIIIKYSDQEVPFEFESRLTVYQWDKVNNQWMPLETNVNTVTNEVSANIENLGTFTLGAVVPYGRIVLIPELRDIDLNTRKEITITSELIKLTNGESVPDGTLFTVSCFDKFSPVPVNSGTIVTPDADPTREGVQVQAKDGIISFAFLPSDKPGTCTITVKSVFGNACGETYITTMANPDADGNTLPDTWEKIYFGSTGHSPDADEDGDGLTNKAEYQMGTHPLKKDTDGDGMDDAWELANNLNPIINDANLDPDRDHYSNLLEYRYWSDPQDRSSTPGIKGDINKSGEIDISDVILCLRQALGLAEFHPLSDMNDDNEINIIDVILVLKKAVGLD